MEQGYVRRQELGLIHILDGPQHQHFLVRAAVFLLVGGCSPQYADHCTHAVVIVALATELLTAQPVATNTILVVVLLLLCGAACSSTPRREPPRATGY